MRTSQFIQVTNATHDVVFGPFAKGDVIRYVTLYVLDPGNAIVAQTEGIEVCLSPNKSFGGGILVSRGALAIPKVAATPMSVYLNQRLGGEHFVIVRLTQTAAAWSANVTVEVAYKWMWEFKTNVGASLAGPGSPGSLPGRP